MAEDHGGEGARVEQRIRLLTGCTEGPNRPHPPTWQQRVVTMVCTATLGGPRRGYRSVLQHLQRMSEDEEQRTQWRGIAGCLYAEVTRRYRTVYPNVPASTPYTGTIPAVGLTHTRQWETLAFTLQDEGPSLSHAPYWSAVLDIYAAGVAGTIGVRPVIGRVLYGHGGSLMIPCDGTLSGVADHLIAQGVSDVRRRGPWCPACPIGCRAVVEQPARR